MSGHYLIFSRTPFFRPITDEDLGALVPLCGAWTGMDELVRAAGCESQAEMEDEFHALFSGMRFPSLDLWESCFLSGDGRLMNELTRDVAASYRRTGLRVDEGVRQPPDH
ncbi:MAG: molecular chaperone TorD family protein, partial [Synergistaceae bacterium]|nr:molecular chaperone TorD family protein [Synergistaceae bacterium]